MAEEISVMKEKVRKAEEEVEIWKEKMKKVEEAIEDIPALFELSRSFYFCKGPNNRGVFQWVVKIEYGVGSNDIDYPLLRIGIARSLFLDDYEKAHIGYVNGTCCFRMGPQATFIQGLKEETFDFTKNDPPAPDNSVVVAEVDVNARTLSFFVNEKKNLKAISHIPPPPLYFAM